MADLRTPSAGLVSLIDASAPLWAAEAEVFRTYWDWPQRSRATDRRWLARQCYKELYDGFVPRCEAVQAGLAQLERSVDRRDLLEEAESAYEELAHYVAFAEAYDAVRDDDSGLDPAWLRTDGNWAENEALGLLRARHRAEHPELGRRAQDFTEGGYCTLYAEGMALAGRGGDDEWIARACAVVYEDEWDHMLVGIAGLDESGLGPGAWDLLTELAVAQSRLRIEMRNAQFGHPVPPARMAELVAGEAPPRAFDYTKAGFAKP